jgi:hypothetical protein
LKKRKYNITIFLLLGVFPVLKGTRFKAELFLIGQFIDINLIFPFRSLRSFDLSANLHVAVIRSPTPLGFGNSNVFFIHIMDAG